MFTPSVLIASAARIVVADTAGAQGDPEMIIRAGRSLDAVAQRWNRMKWKFLQSDQYISLAAPFTVTGCAATAGSTTITTTVASGFASVLIDDMAVADALRIDTLILSGTGTASTALTLNAAASATVTNATLTFRRPIYALATNFKAVYDIRISGQRPLFYVQRRQYDQVVLDQQSASTVVAYDLYLVGDRGKIRFIAPPSSAQTALVRYHRRIAMPTVASALALDIPQDFEDVFLAASKAHFLADKADSAPRLGYWDRYAREGLAQMRSDEAFLPDEVLTFEPPRGNVYDSSSGPMNDYFYYGA